MAEDLTFSTEIFPERERFDAWRDTCHDLFRLVGEPLRETAAPFSAAIVRRRQGPLQTFLLDFDGARLHRGKREIADRAWDGYLIYRQQDDRGLFDISGQEYIAERGALVITDFDQTFDARPATRFHNHVLAVPKALLNPYLTARDRPRMRILPGQAGMEALVATYLETLIQEWDNFDDPAMGVAADTLCRLLGVAIGGSPEAEADAVRAGRLIEAKRYIERNLTNPSLSSASAAAALRVSERALYASFEGSGTSFAAYVRHRRFESCHAALLVNPSRPVTDIAFAWGFNSLASFYRGFQTAFGMSPGDVRETARGQIATGGK